MYDSSLPDKHLLMQRLHRECPTDLPADTRLLTLTLSLPSDLLSGLPGLENDWFYWAYPQAGSYLFGLGQAYCIKVSGSKRLSALASAWRALQPHWLHHDLDHSGIDPIAFTGFAFDGRDNMEDGWQGLPNAMLIIPALVLQQDQQGCHLSFSCVQPQTNMNEVLQHWQGLLEILLDALAMPSLPKQKLHAEIKHHPPLMNWPTLVAKALDAIASGQMKKVVLARNLRLEAQRNINPAELMSVLDTLYPDCRHFAVRSKDLVFAAATPERLVTRSGDQVHADALAGSCPVSEDDRLDQSLAEALLHSTKTRHEHQLVVEGMVDTLQPLCERIELADHPVLLRLRHVQHLWTEIRALPKPGINLFDLAACLHPTAAVSGTPSRHAQDWIFKEEGMARGWYTGGGGFIKANGDGEIAVLLRCARLHREEAVLYAGAGIVEGSDVEAERREIDVKLKAILEALGLV